MNKQKGDEIINLVLDFVEVKKYSVIDIETEVNIRKDDREKLRKYIGEIIE